MPIGPIMNAPENARYNFQTSADFDNKVGYACALGSDGRVSVAGAGVSITGICIDVTDTGATGSIAAQLYGIAKVVAGAAVAENADLATDASGKLVTATAGDPVVARSLTAAAADGDAMWVLLGSGSTDAGGSVDGPASATDNAVVRFNGTTGDLLQDSSVLIDDSDNISGLGTVGCGAITSTGTSGFANVTASGTLGVTGLTTATGGLTTGAAGALTLGAGLLATAETTKTGAYTVAATDYFIPCDTNAVGAFDVTLPDATTVSGQSFRIADVQGNAGVANITVKSAGGTVNGIAAGTGQVIAKAFGHAEYISDGTNWLGVAVSIA